MIKRRPWHAKGASCWTLRETKKIYAICYTRRMKKYTFTTTIHKEGGWYVAQCAELGVTTQGKTLAEAKKNIKEAVGLYLEDVPSREIPPQASVVHRLQVTNV